MNFKFELNKQYKTSTGEKQQVIFIHRNGDVTTVCDKEFVHKYTKEGEPITGNGIPLPRTPWLTIEEYTEPIKYSASVWLDKHPKLSEDFPNNSFQLSSFLFGNVSWSSRPTLKFKEYRITVEEV